MTVGTAVIAKATNADGGKTDVVILSADRMFTVGDGIREYTLRDQTKLFWFNSQIAALVADNVDDALGILRAAHDEFVQWDNPTVRGVASLVAEKFRAHRKRRIEEKILSLYGLDWNSYTGQQRSNLAPSVLERIVAEMETGLGVVNATMIVAGLDAGRVGHLYRVSDPGTFTLCDAEGYTAIGIGGEHAETVFTDAEYTHNRTWTEAVALTYFAKKRAEIASGVGEDTDLYWMHSGGYAEIEPASPFMRELEKLYKTKKAREEIDFQKDHKKILQLMKKFKLKEG